jgi:hypothetical protein
VVIAWLESKIKGAERTERPKKDGTMSTKEPRDPAKATKENDR